jgi:hypothetical protein
VKVLIDVDVFGAGTDKPEIWGGLREFYPHFSSAYVTTTNTAYTTISFHAILRILDD